MAIGARLALRAVLVAAALAAGGGWAAGEGSEGEAAAGQATVTDPATGRVVAAPRYGGTLTAAAATDIPNTDQSIGGAAAGSGQLRRGGEAGHRQLGHRPRHQSADRPVSRRQPLHWRAGAALGGGQRHHLPVHRPRRRELARQGANERASAHRLRRGVQLPAAERRRSVRRAAAQRRPLPAARVQVPGGTRQPSPHRIGGAARRRPADLPGR